MPDLFPCLCTHAHTHITNSCFPGKHQGLDPQLIITDQLCSSQQRQADLHLLKERGYLTLSPQSKGPSTLLFDSCHEAPALEDKLWRFSGWKRKWSNWSLPSEHSAMLFLFKKIKLAFTQSSVFLPYMAFGGLVLDWTWENPGADQLTPVKPSTAPIRFTSYILQLISGSPNIQSSSHLLDYGSYSYNISKSSTKGNNPHTLITFWHCCHCDFFFLTVMLHSWVSSVFCTKNYGIFQSPQTVSWLLKSQLEEHMCWRVNTLF